MTIHTQAAPESDPRSPSQVELDLAHGTAPHLEYIRDLWGVEVAIEVSRDLVARLGAEAVIAMYRDYPEIVELVSQAGISQPPRDS